MTGASWAPRVVPHDRPAGDPATERREPCLCRLGTASVRARWPFPRGTGTDYALARGRCELARHSGRKPSATHAL